MVDVQKGIYRMISTLPSIDTHTKTLNAFLPFYFLHIFYHHGMCTITHIIFFLLSTSNGCGHSGFRSNISYQTGEWDILRLCPNTFIIVPNFTTSQTIFNDGMCPAESEVPVPTCLCVKEW